MMQPYGSYVLLDRTDPDAPMWALVSLVATRQAELEITGAVSSEELLDVLAWITRESMTQITFRPVPSPVVYGVVGVNDAA